MFSQYCWICETQSEAWKIKVLYFNMHLQSFELCETDGHFVFYWEWVAHVYGGLNCHLRSIFYKIRFHGGASNLYRIEYMTSLFLSSQRKIQQI